MTDNFSDVTIGTEAPPAERSDAELRAELEQQIARLKHIEVQLGQHRRYDSDGRMFSMNEFEDWRRQAKFAKEATTLRLRKVKNELRTRNALGNPQTGDGLSLILAIDAKLDRTNELLERIVELLEETESADD